MAKLTLLMSMSIDGYVVKPNGMSAGFMREPIELKRWKLDRIAKASAHAMGRVTYNEMKAVWPTSTDPYAEPMNRIPKIVFSRSPDNADWPKTRVMSGDLSQKVSALRQSFDGEIIVWGGACLAQSLVRADLIDEFVLITNPLAYGGGKALFADLPAAIRFDALATTCFEGGHILRVLSRSMGD